MADDIDTLIFNQQQAAFGMLSRAGGQFDQAIQLLLALGAQPIPANTLPSININPPAPGDPGVPPVFNGSKFIAPTFDAVAPTLQAVPPLVLPPDPGAVPSVLPFVMPLLSVTVPDGSLLDGAPSVAAAIDVPTAPDLLGEIHGIPLPDLIPLSIPAAPQFIAPEFQGVRPLFNATPPTDLDVTFRQQYDTMAPVFRATVDAQFDAFMDREFPQFRSGLAAIESRLATYLAGGTALSPAIEDAIYSRTQGKVAAEAARTRDENWNTAARAGHTIPTPILLNLQSELEQAGLEQLGKAAMEIAIDQAKREQENLQFAVRQSTDLRKIAIDAGMAYYGHLVGLNGQALEYAREVVNAIVKVFDLAARYAEIQARLYESDARVFEARLVAAKAVIDVYAEQIRAEEAKATVNTQLIAQYRTRISAVESEASVYRSLIEALGLNIQLKRVEAEVYDTRVRAFGSQVNAETAQYQGFEAAVRGQASAVQASAEQVRAFSAKAAAYGEVVRAKATAIDSVNRTNESATRTYQAQAEVFRTLTLGQAEVIKAEVESFGATIQGFMAKANAISEHSRAETASYEAGLRAIVATAEIFLKEMQETDNLRIHRAEGIARIASDLGNIYGRAAGSALAGMNTLIASTASTST